MITILSPYQPHTAWLLFSIFYLQFFTPLLDYPADVKYEILVNSLKRVNAKNKRSSQTGFPNKLSVNKNINDLTEGTGPRFPASVRTLKQNFQPGIGGPSSPEASSFKAVGGNNLVNLFTGDFSYSIPLMDVGGYPVNLFYSAGIGMEQEASWVGLGWNLNPGTVSRNMRGIPDDFNGTDLLTVHQNVRPNRTFGAELGLDVELLGLKKPSIGVGFNTGISYNNYLGPELTLGTKLSVSLSAMDNVGAEKSAASSPAVTAALGAKLSSRSGLTFSPSLSANLPLMSNWVNQGIGLSTSYNSRTGIKDLNISGQVAKSAALGISLTPGLHAGTSISFAKQSYLPTLRMPMKHLNTSAQVEFGAGFYGVRGSLSGMGFYTESVVPDESKIVRKPLVGYIYSELANVNENAVMDFHRLGDAEVTPNTPIIAAPQYDYDIFSIQGEGTGGTIRAYRGDLGFMRDNTTLSSEQNFSIGVDIAPPMHYGGNFNSISTPTRVGGWNDHTNSLSKTMSFQQAVPNASFENVYFRNPAEATVTDPQLLSRVGDDHLVKFQLGGTANNVSLLSALDLSDKNTGTNRGSLLLNNSAKLVNRQKRTQVITMLNANDAAIIGLEKSLRSYSGSFDTARNILYQALRRDTGYRKGHHISEINVLEQTGMRYVYGIPVYSLGQTDYTFSVKEIADSNNLVNFFDQEPTIYSPHLASFSSMDGYVQSQQIPSYASSFLLTGLLSPDFVDVTGNGITEDDLGTAVKFNYALSGQTHRWRTPRNNQRQRTAFFNEGLKTEHKDNKATITYGEREVWYLNAIESKSMIAIFRTEERDDAKGVNGPLDGTVNANEQANKKLSRIDLYTKAAIKAKGIYQARPLKSVFFVYDYSLCKGTPDNAGGQGKLTLKEIQFCYNGQVKSKDRYVFNYGNQSSAADNPGYAINASDRWGTYKNNAANPGQLKNPDHPFTTNVKNLNDEFAAAWSLRKILLPSGGQIEVSYEADDYAYTQNRRACNIFALAGLGNTTSFATGNRLYETAEDNYYVYVQVNAPLSAIDPVKRKAELYKTYLEGIQQLAFRLQVKMPKGLEPLTCYAAFDDYGVCPNNSNYFFIHLKSIEGKSPLAKTALSFLTGNLPSQAFPGYEMEVKNLEDFIAGSISLLGSLGAAFKNVERQMRDRSKAREVALEKSFLRLTNPQKKKFGGGLRVKQVLLRDNWDRMTGQYASVYGQDYDYTTKEKIGDQPESVSSGVASYEPGIGSEENPFREILEFSDKLPLAPAEYGAIEMPMLEGFYPSPVVGYSKVTVRSIHRKGTHGDSSVRSAIGKQVTEFYTAKDFPSYAAYTTMDSREYHKNPVFSLFKKEIKDHRTISQGFLVETNDMHGKIKAQLVFSESDEQTPLSASYHAYKNTGRNGLKDKVDFVFKEEGGAVHAGNMGIDVELMTDVREFSVKSNGINLQGQLDLFIFPLMAFTIPSFYRLLSFGENRYRSVTCTKLINYHAIEDSVIVVDKGSVISTKTIAYDAETGGPLISQTANAFKDPVYTTNYPAYWAYSSAGLACNNIGHRFTGVNFHSGKIVSGVADLSIFESGDELFVEAQSGGGAGCVNPSDPVSRLWVLNIEKNSSALSPITPEYTFIDSIGRPFTKNGVTMRIVRSGRRNNLGLMLGAVTSLEHPIQNQRLVIQNPPKVIAASAVEFKEKWQVDREVIRKRTYFPSPCGERELDSIFCEGQQEKKINPYLKGLLGNLKASRSYAYFGSREQEDVHTPTAIRKDGAIKDFVNYWTLGPGNHLVPAPTNERWVWNTEVTKINSKGNELETRDALNRHTSAQYGFDNSLAIAMVQNARFGEAFSESFEDHNYNEAVYDQGMTKCVERFINLGLTSNATVVNAASANVTAHSGQYVLKMPPGSLVRNQALTPIVENFNIDFSADTVKSLFQTGGILSNIFASPTIQTFNATAHFGTGTTAAAKDYLMQLEVYNTLAGGSSIAYNYAYKVIQYIQIPSSGTYEFYQRLLNNGDDPLNGQGMTVSITNAFTGFPVAVSATGVISGFGTKTYTMSGCFAAGIYKIVSTCNSSNCGTGLCLINPKDIYQLWFPDQYHLVSYQTLQSIPGCEFKLAIPATKEMLNPLFSPQVGKRMLFSAWVREDCGTVNDAPCYDSTYQHTYLDISFDNQVVSTIKPSGPIIEGWQKLEGEFTIPSNATLLKMEFFNNNNKPVYLDDVRMHPFNANMKSYVYDPLNLRLSAELDENNHTTFYEYDDEGQLVRIKKETIQGIKTIKETRTAKQKSVREIL